MPRVDLVKCDVWGCTRHIYGGVSPKEARDVGWLIGHRMGAKKPEFYLCEQCVGRIFHNEPPVIDIVSPA